jgi:hypothetical protein
MKKVKIFGLRSRVVWLVFIFLIASIFAFMIASLSVQEWVEMNPEPDMYEFKGNLVRMTNDLKIPSPFKFRNPNAKRVNTTKIPYAGMSCGCDFVVHAVPFGGLYPSDDLYRSWRDLFRSLSVAGNLYIVCEVCALACCVIVIVTLALFYKDIYYFNFNFSSSVCLWISHVIGILGWIGIVDPSFDGDCDKLTDGEEAPTVCALTGPILGVFILIYSSLVLILYYIAFCVFVRNFDKRNHKRITKGAGKTDRNVEVGDLNKENQE